LTKLLQFGILGNLPISVVDPDHEVGGPPGSKSFHQAKRKKNLDFYCFFTSLRLYISEAVLQIHEIFVWIRIPGSMPLDKWIRMRILLYSSFTFKTPTKTNKKNFFCLLLFEGTFTTFFKENKSQRSHKTVGMKVYLTIFAW
jgi:hypothetical protein